MRSEYRKELNRHMFLMHQGQGGFVLPQMHGAPTWMVDLLHWRMHTDHRHMLPLHKHDFLFGDPEREEPDIDEKERGWPPIITYVEKGYPATEFDRMMREFSVSSGD